MKVAAPNPPALNSPSCTGSASAWTSPRLADFIDDKRKLTAGAMTEIDRQRIEGEAEQARVAQQQDPIANRPRENDIRSRRRPLALMAKIRSMQWKFEQPLEGVAAMA